MIKIKYGNTRIALILLNWFVIKFPNPRIDWIRFSGWDIKTIPRKLYQAFLYGVSANINEALFYEEVRFYEHRIDTILAPVFSVGVLNFQQYLGEDTPTPEEVDDFIKGFPDEVFKLYRKCNAHDVGYYNWRKTSHGLKIIDFALPPLRSDLAYFLRAVISHDFKIEMRKRGVQDQS